MIPASWVFTALLALMGVLRVVELRLSRANVASLVMGGAEATARDGFGLIVAVHVSFFVLALVEFVVSPRAGYWGGSVFFAVLFLAGTALRYWAITTLGSRWSVRVVVLPGAPLVARGPYRFFRHPNYVGVIVELLAFPLIFGLFATAALVTLANGVALARRIAIEERALAAGAIADASAPPKWLGKF
ncbi:MAG: isoprenylcysteine carboxylmethyltransferase family protein [Thermoplasmatota archaeon]